MFAPAISMKLKSRSAVEDTRLEAMDRQKTEAKAKDSPCEDRTDLLEAKDSNARGQGPSTQAQVLPKKKVFTKIFQAISKQKKSLAKNFSGAPQNFNNS